MSPAAISTNKINISSLKYIKFCNSNIPNYTKLSQIYWNIKHFNLIFWGVLCTIHTFKIKLISRQYLLVKLSHSTHCFLVWIFVVCGCLHLWVDEWVWVCFSFTLLLFWGFLHLNIICFVLCVVWQCLNYAGILQSVSGSFSSGCESNGGHAWGFVFVQAYAIHICVGEWLVIQIFTCTIL